MSTAQVGNFDEFVLTACAARKGDPAFEWRQPRHCRVVEDRLAVDGQADGSTSEVHNTSHVVQLVVIQRQWCSQQARVIHRGHHRPVEVEPDLLQIRTIRSGVETTRRPVVPRIKRESQDARSVRFLSKLRNWTRGPKSGGIRKKE